MLVGAVIVAVAVAGLLVYWFVFRWEATPKRWCVMFYMTSNTPASTAPVSRPDQETGIPAATPAAATLDDKLDQVVNVIRRLPCATVSGIAADPAWDDVYVVYRAIWDDPFRNPEARVVRPELSAPATTHFPGETMSDVEYAIDFTKDLTQFFEWAYDNCPAQQYAVFFWGHAMGPAGFFQPSEKPKVVPPLMAFLMEIVFRLTGVRWSGPPGLPAISDAIGSIVQQRYKDSGQPAQFETVSGAAVPPTNPLSPGGPATPVDPDAPVVFTVGQTIPKVDVVLFQDCWMSTLETAFELQDDVRYIVSSQSLVPVGFDAAKQLGAVWPYKELIDTFLHPSNFATPMMQVLQDFYDGALPPGTPPGYNRYPTAKVLFSLMDCGTTAGAVSAALQADYQALVQALFPLGAVKRSALIELSFDRAGRLYELSGADLKVGDQALVDVLTLCAYLQMPAAWPAGLVVSNTEANAIRAAAQAVEQKLAALVVDKFQSPQQVPGEFVYTGVAALYKPFAIFGDDPFIVNAFRSSYEKFRFAQETDVTPPSTSGGTSGQSWTQYAFDRYKWF